MRTKLLGGVGFLAVVVCAALVAWPEGPRTGAGGGRAAPVDAAPREVIVQHVLVSFRGAAGFGKRLPLRARHRSPDEAQRLADSLLLMARNQEPFNRLVRRHSDDRAGEHAPSANGAPCADGCGPSGEAPGAYRVIVGAPEISQRTGIAAALHDTLVAAAARLAPGEVALVAYDPVTVPLGHHLVRRLR